MHNLLKSLENIITSYYYPNRYRRFSTSQERGKLTANEGDQAAENQGMEADQFESIELTTQQATQLIAPTETL